MGLSTGLTSLPQEQKAKTIVLSVRIKQKQYFVLCTVEEGVANTCM